MGSWCKDGGKMRLEKKLGILLDDTVTQDGTSLPLYSLELIPIVRLILTLYRKIGENYHDVLFPLLESKWDWRSIVKSGNCSAIGINTTVIGKNK